MSLISPAALLFDEVARVGSIRKAAEHLNVSPSALNRRILNLEEEYGLQLFERLPRGVRLTAAGEVLVADIRKWKVDQERSKVRLQELQGLRRGHVSVGMMECFSGEFTQELFDEIRTRFNRFTLDVFVGGTALIVEKVLASELDLAVCFNVPDRPNITKLMVQQAPLGVILSKTHPLAGRAALPLSECINYPFILPDFSIAVRRMIDSALTAASVKAVPSLVTNSIGLIKRLLKDDQHIAFLNAGNVLDEVLDANLKFVPISGRQTTADELSLVIRSSLIQTPAVNAVISLLMEQMEKLPLQGLGGE